MAYAKCPDCKCLIHFKLNGNQTAEEWHKQHTPPGAHFPEIKCVKCHTPKVYVEASENPNL